jgi:KipI family sensor histidine kinase inhibitor
MRGVVEIRRVGAHALLLDVDDPAAWHAELCRRRATGELSAVDVVPAARTVLLDGVPDPVALAEMLPGWSPAAADDTVAGPLVELPVRYGGPDLPDVARHWGVTEAEVVARLAGTQFRVAFVGFAPGFAYLTGLPAELAVPRLATPRERVPAGSLGLAGEYAGVYPTASPGGWLLVGRTDAELFHVERDPPALLTPGARVRWVS